MSENKHNEEIVTSQNPETSNVQPSSDSNDENQQPENSSSTQDETENQDNAPIELDVPLVNPADSDFNLEEDPEAMKAIRKEWRKNRHLYKERRKLTPIRTLLMLGVVGFVPWYIAGERQNIEYFFSSSDPIDLGIADTYRLADDGEVATAQDFTDNRYVKIQGIPIRHTGIQVKENPVMPRTKKLIYQLMGSSIFVEEDMKDSKYAAFMSQTSTAFNPNQILEPLSVEGRLRRFDTADAKRYAPVRDYYSKKYGTVFCEGMSDAERKQKAALLGRGGVAIQIMPDGSVIQAETDTNTTLLDIQPLQGRSAMAVGADNTLLHTIDAGLTWRKAELPFKTKVSSMTHDPASSQIIFAGEKGWVGSESWQPDPHALAISQDIKDVTFTTPEPGHENVPRIIAVGREGLLQIAYADREGWRPANIDNGQRFNDVLLVGDTWFAVGGNDLLLSRHQAILDDPTSSWNMALSPVHADWLGLSTIPGYVVATGTKGAIARYDLTKENATWELWPVDDVPGIEFEEDIHASVTSGDGKTWVGVGKNGSILVSKTDENGVFGPIQRISGSYASYGVIRDILAKNSVEASLYEALKRHTTEDFYDVTWHDGTFYAVGTDSTLFMSKDGLSWQKRSLHVKHKTLRSIVFTGPKSGVIGGEKGTMLVTDDNGETWRSKKAQTDRSIYDIAVAPNYPNGYVFTGAYGLWGFCESTEGMCYLRSRNEDYHYRAIALAPGQQQKGLLHVVLAGDDARLDSLHDAPGDAVKKLSTWTAPRSQVYAMAVADTELPLMPDSARGHLGLIAVGNGSIFRSLDGGYTFHREETGANAPIRDIVMSKSGHIVWTFGDGGAFEDLRGLGKWHPISANQSFKAGVLGSKQGWLIDNTCVYEKTFSTGEVKKSACIDATGGQTVITDIALNGDKILLTIASELKTNARKLSLAELQQTETGAQISVLPAITAPGSDFAHIATRYISCGDQTALHDTYHQKMLLPNQAQLDHISDVACLDGKLTWLKSEASDKPGIWEITVSQENAEIFTINAGFDTTHAKFARNAAGRWWLAVESQDAAEPLILMSQDTQKWSWRRDRITDFYAVKTAGQYAVAVGDNGNILYSENYGQNWQVATSSSTQTLRGLCLSSDGDFGLAVGDAGTIYLAKNGLQRWSKLKSKFDIDFTSCTIAENTDRFQIYIAGKGGAIYTTTREMNRFELIASPAIEDIYAIDTLETGEVIAVGGVYQDPSEICEEGYLVVANQKPRDIWGSMILLLILAGFWAYTVWTLLQAFIHRKDKPRTETADLSPASNTQETQETEETSQAASEETDEETEK